MTEAVRSELKVVTVYGKLVNGRFHDTSDLKVRSATAEIEESTHPLLNNTSNRVSLLR